VAITIVIMDSPLFLNLDDAIAELDRIEEDAATNLIQDEQHHNEQQQQQQQRNKVVDTYVPDEEQDIDEDNAAELPLTEVPEAPLHPIVLYSQSTGNKTHINDDVVIDSAIAYLHYHATYTKNCLQVAGKKGKTNSCTCMSVFAINSNGTSSILTRSAARFIAFFVKQSRSTQQQYVMSWYRAASLQWTAAQANHARTNTRMGGNTSLHFQVPLLCDPEEGVLITTNVPLVCMSAIQIVSGQKVCFWRICIRAVQTNTIPEHGLTGKKSNNAKVKPETLDSLSAFFTKMELFVMSYQLGLLGTKPVPQLLTTTKRKDLCSLLAGQKEACTVDGVMIMDGTLV
jgi:hypothetical protein